MEGEECIPGGLNAEVWRAKKAGYCSCQPLLLYLCLKFSINQGRSSPLSLSQERKALLHVMERARVTGGRGVVVYTFWVIFWDFYADALWGKQRYYGNRQTKNSDGGKTDCKGLDNLSARITYLEPHFYLYAKVAIWGAYLLDCLRHICVN